VAALALILSLVATSPALADEVAAHVAGIRSENLPVIAGADQVAGGSAAAQAASGKLFHADLSGLLAACDSVGEVVGTGPDIPAVFAAFRNSATHWNLLNNPAWTAIGTGQATGGDGMVYVSVVFCRQNGGSSSVAPPVATSPPLVGTATTARNIAPRTAELEEALPAIGARRSEIRARLDGQAESMLPDWYVGLCGVDDRRRVLESTTNESGACPLAS
jgi:hypothetical protein